MSGVIRAIILKEMRSNPTSNVDVKELMPLSLFFCSESFREPYLILFDGRVLQCFKSIAIAQDCINHVNKARESATIFKNDLSSISNEIDLFKMKYEE